MKLAIKYLIILFFAVNGGLLMYEKPMYSFFWWLGLINLAFWGAYLVDKLFKYLED